MSAHKKEPTSGPTRPARFALGRRTVMVAIISALVASAVFRWMVIGAWRGTPLEVVPTVKAQGMWCGKYYEQGQPPRTPGGNFPVPPKSSTPLLRFECWPGLRPYVSGLDTTGSVLLSASSVDTAPGTAYDSLKDGSVFRVSAEVDGKPIASKVSLTLGAPIGESEFTWSKLGLAPRREGYNLTCSATSAKSGKVFNDQATVFYLPPVPESIGGVVQTDGRTGAMLVPNKQNTKREPLFPFGFYTSFGGYLEKNLTILDEIKEQGFNMVHPVPTFDNKTALELVLDRMEELGLWLVYDMRWAYKNLTVVRAEVESVKKRKNVLAWYTADEPDGWGDPLDAPQKAADLINELDGYRPVALVLNCADYHFSEYSAGHQIITHDTYPIGINATWSTVWNTPCTPEVGDCGCDNCHGQFEDIAIRLDEFQDRLIWEGRSKDVVVWTVPQAFGQESYWPRRPTSQEIVLEMLLAINHGSLGVMPWIDSPSDPLMRPGIYPLARVIPALSSFVLGDRSLFGRPNVSTQRVDVTTWTRNGKTLLIALNLNDAPVQSEVQTDRTYSKPSVVYENGAQVMSVSGRVVKIMLQPLSSIAVIL